MKALLLALGQIISFTKRDMHSWASYRIAATGQFLNIFIAVFAWGVTATFVQRPVEQMYHSDYISFLVVGVAISSLIMPVSQGIQQRINPWTLETILTTGVSTPVFVIGNITWTYVLSAIGFVPYLVIGILFFHAHLHVNVFSTIVAFALSAMMLMGLAMISTGLRIVTKSADPVTWAINVLGSLFAGIAFPVTYLNTILFPGASTISWLLPQTWVYHLCRLAMLDDPSLANPAMLFEFLKGAAFAAVLLPLGYVILRWGINRSMREGTLGWY